MYIYIYIYTICNIQYTISPRPLANVWPKASGFGSGWAKRNGDRAQSSGEDAIFALVGSAAMLGGFTHQTSATESWRVYPFPGFAFVHPSEMYRAESGTQLEQRVMKTIDDESTHGIAK